MNPCKEHEVEEHDSHGDIDIRCVYCELADTRVVAGELRRLLDDGLNHGDTGQNIYWRVEAKGLLKALREAE
jgi:hypothetical protein